MGRQIQSGFLASEIAKYKPKKVLDVGGSWEPGVSSTHVLDIEPRPAGRDEIWIQGDACQSETWDRFDRDEFDFALCTHTLEDVYDPIYVV